MKKCGMIFMLDDDVLMLEMYATFLRAHGLDVFATDNAYKMILYAREIHPNAIILDVNMPVMNGWQVLETLKSDNKLQDIPIIMLTAADEVQKAIKLGAANFLLKPVEPLKLLAVIEDYCEYYAQPAPWLLNKIQSDSKKINFIK